MSDPIVQTIVKKLYGDQQALSDDLRALAMDLARWANEQRYHQGFSERMARQAESVLRAAVEAERAPLVEALKPFALGWGQDLSGEQEDLLRSSRWGRHCEKAYRVLFGARKKP